MTIRVPRLGAVLAVLLVTPLLTGLGTAPAPAAAPEDQRIAAGQTTQALRGTAATSTVEVPAGLVPVRLIGRITRDDADLPAVLSVDGVVVHTSSGPAVDDFRVDVPASVAGARTLEISLRYADRDSTERCPSWQPTFATLSDLVVAYRGTAAAPTTVADFLPAASPAVLVQVPTDASAEVAEAGLTAVAALADRYPADTDVRLVDAAAPLPRWRTGARLVRLADGAGAVEGTVTAEGEWPLLTLTGGKGLSAAAAALADPALGLVASADVTDLGRTAELPSAEALEARLHHTLGDVLGEERLVLDGFGTTTRFVDLSQDLFGGPVDKVDLDLRGTHTAVPAGGRIQLDVVVNDYLVDSVAFDADDPADFELSTTVPRGVLGGANGLQLRMSATPGGGECVDPRTMPLEVHLDLEGSTVTGRRGSGTVTGFARFPQALGGRLDVAVAGEGETRLAHLSRAGAVVVALQRAAREPLRIDLVEPADLVEGHRSGLLVGASTADAEDLDAPLRLAEARVMDYADATFQALSGAPFAALETFRHNGRDLLLLGGWGSDAAAQSVLQDRLAAHVADEGWTALADDVLVATGEGEPFVLNSNAVIPQEDRIDARRGYVLWLVLGVAVLVLLLAVNLWLGRRRRRRVAALVDAQEAAERDAEPSP